MSNKPFNRLIPSEALLRQTIPIGPQQIHGTVLTIEMLHRFELFNTRPYHNYETWSMGWRVTGFDVIVQSEDLDDVIRLWVDKYKAIPKGAKP